MKRINKIRLIVLLSGFVSMELELLGTRLISPIFGSTIYVWTSLIGVTLTFLALGYWYGGKLADKGKVNLNKLGLIILFLGIYVGLLPFISRIIFPWFIGLGIVLGPLIISLLILAFPIFFLGFVVPTSVKLVTDSLSEVGRKSGQIYALATVGSILGTFVTGFFLILYFGVTKTALITGAILILLSLVVIKNKKIPLVILLIPIFLILQSQIVYPTEVLQSLDSHYGQFKVVGERGHIRLYSGALMLSSVNLETKDNELLYSKYLEIPFIYNSEHKEVLMIGLAGGAVARELIGKYDLNMDIVEIEPKMLDLAREHFYWNDNAVVYFDDGRHFVYDSDKKYDAIIIDVGLIFPAWNLYTKEAFQEYGRHLNDDGMLIINLVASKEGEYARTTKSIYKTLDSVFEDVIILKHPHIESTEIQSIIFFASKKEIDRNKLVLLESPFNYFSIEEIMDNYDLKENLNVKLNTDDFPIAEFYDYENFGRWGIVTKEELKYVLP